MMYLLDTVTISEVTRPQPDEGVLDWLAVHYTDAWLSVITLGELRKGILSLAPGRRRADLTAWLDSDLMARFAHRIAPVTVDVAHEWGRLVAEAGRDGATVPALDGLIAATAAVHGLTVVTRNARDFAWAGIPATTPWRP